MQWIERLMGIAPDGGTGSLELLIVAVPLALIVYAVVRWSHRGEHDDVERH